MIIDLETRSVVLKAEDPFLIRDLLPKASRSINHPDYNTVVRYNLETARVLNNIGVKVVSPIEHDYDWPGKYAPKPHQRVMSSFMTLHQRCFNLSEMGTMKTAAALWAADYLMKLGAVRKCVILSPLSTLNTVWMHDIFDVLMHRNAVVLRGDKDSRARKIAANVDFYVVNHDGLGIRQVRDFLRSEEIDLFIIDEASKFRNDDTDKYKFLAGILKPRHRLWLMTGTPIPNHPVDAWALARMVSPKNVPEHRGTFERSTMYQIPETKKWKPKPQAKEVVYAALQPAVRFEKRDCGLNLPPVTIKRYEARLSKEQQVAFDAMRKEMKAEIASGIYVTAINAADRINKLRQICLGSIKDQATGKYVTIDHKPRMAETLSIIRSATAKALVIVPFKGIIRELERELIAAGLTVGVLNGDVSQTARDKIIHRFKNEPDPETLLCHPQVMAHGLNLTEADLLLFYGPIYSNDDYEQVVERNNRVGQVRPMTIARLGAVPLEWSIYGLVDAKGATQSGILQLYRELTE